MSCTLGRSNLPHDFFFPCEGGTSGFWLKYLPFVCMGKIVHESKNKKYRNLKKDLKEFKGHDLLIEKHVRRFYKDQQFEEIQQNLHKKDPEINNRDYWQRLQEFHLNSLKRRRERYRIHGKLSKG